jgi:hypothetical protein
VSRSAGTSHGASDLGHSISVSYYLRSLWDPTFNVCRATPRLAAAARACKPETRTRPAAPLHCHFSNSAPATGKGNARTGDIATAVFDGPSTASAEECVAPTRAPGQAGALKGGVMLCQLSSFPRAIPWWSRPHPSAAFVGLHRPPCLRWEVGRPHAENSVAFDLANPVFTRVL